MMRCPFYEFLDQLIEPSLDSSFLGTFGPASPSFSVAEERIWSFATPLEDKIGCFLKALNATKDGVVKTWDVDVHGAKINLQHIICVFSKFRGVDDAAHVAG